MIKNIFKTMKLQKAIQGTLLFTTLGVTGLYAKFDTTSNMYSKTMIVTALMDEDDLVVLEDANGQCWTFEGIEDWFVGDVASVLMNNNGTITVYDDEIVNVHYSGFTKDFNF